MGSQFTGDGGGINAGKKWYGIGFEWENEAWRCKTPEELPGELTIINVDNTVVALTRVAPESARETLGAFLSPDNTTGPQLEKLKGKAREFVDCIWTGRIFREDAEQGM